MPPVKIVKKFPLGEMSNSFSQVKYPNFHISNFVFKNLVIMNNAKFEMLESRFRE